MSSKPWQLHCGAAHERWLRDTTALLDSLGVRWDRGESLGARSIFGAGALPVIEIDGDYIVNPNRFAIERLAEDCTSHHAA
ncbi:MAG: hypothetical protein ACRD2J_06905 [Thermoanaerobaculia bacterium]